MVAEREAHPSSAPIRRRAALPPKPRRRSNVRAIRVSLKRDFGEAAQLARMQALQLLLPQPLQRFQADLEMLADPLPIEIARHAGELDFTMQRLVRDAEQRAVGNAKAK